MYKSRKKIENAYIILPSKVYIQLLLPQIKYSLQLSGLVT